jgi:hypothetical protein
MFAMVIGSIGLLKWVVAIITFDSPRGAPHLQSEHFTKSLWEIGHDVGSGSFPLG